MSVRLTIIKNLLHLIKWLTFSKVGVFIHVLNIDENQERNNSSSVYYAHFFFINFNFNGHLLRILKLLQLPGMKWYVKNILTGIPPFLSYIYYKHAFYINL